MRIAVVPGDGIGPEVIEQGLRVLAATADAVGLSYDVTRFPHGADHYLSTGVLADERLFAALAEHDAVYLGAVGDPTVPPGVLEHGLLVAITRAFAMDISYRPYRLHAQRLSPLRDAAPDSIDMAIVRESAEDVFAVPSGTLHPGTPEEIEVGGVAFSRATVEATLRHGFELAGRRRGRVTVVDHSNAAAVHSIWRRTYEELRTDYPAIEAEHVVADAFAMHLVTDPGRFDTVVTSWMLGGIFTDIAAGLTGGLGLSGSVRLGPRLSLFEPAHGSAPKYAGAGVASPLGAISALGLLLDHLGRPDAGALVHSAVRQVLVDGSIPSASARSGVSTSSQGDFVISALRTAARSGPDAPTAAPLPT